MERWIWDFIAAMPKAELHLHLDGALRIKTALDLAEQSGWQGFEKKYNFREIHEKMVVSKNLASQKELLAYFQVPSMLLQTEEALRRVTYELLLDKAADEVRYCEIRFAPLLHLQRGLTVQQVLEAVLAGQAEAQAQVDIRSVLIVVGMRGAPLNENLSLLEAAAPYRSKGVVAADFAGIEADNPDPLRQKAYFQRAKQLDFYTTFHCGEIPSSAPILRKAIKTLAPDRIAHGAIAVNDPKLCEDLRRGNIMLDLCPTSNVQAGLYCAYWDYPLEILYRDGVPVSVNTDDPVLSGVSLSDEYRNILDCGSLTVQDCWKINLNALDAGFIDGQEKKELRRKFEEWASAAL